MIVSTANAQIKNILKLQEKSRERMKQEVFIVEGMKMLLEAPAERVVKIFVSESIYESKSDIRDAVKKYEHEIVSDEIFPKISDTKTPQGVLGIVKMVSYEIKALLYSKEPLFLILEDIQDPGNLGTMMRTAEAAGVDAVIMSRQTVDIYNPKVVRATMGAIYRVPFLYEENLLEVIAMLKQRQIAIFAAHLNSNAYYDEKNYQSGTAFLIGNEGKGLSSHLTDVADETIKIPMCGKAESLNASVAAALLMYEANRQRRK